MSKLILGTAQFGSDYGIKHDGQPFEKEIERIAKVAWDGGIRVIHTSWQYNLPKICEAIFDGFEWIEKDKQNPDYFRWGNKINKYGKSIYAFSEIAHHPFVDYYIVPINILDNRFSKDLKESNHLFLQTSIIIARSVFLQGLLLMDDLPSWVNGMGRAKINLFHHICKQEGYEYYEAALGYVLGIDEIDHVIVGVNSARQLEQLLKVKPLKWDYDFSITDENILDPRKWPKA